MNHALTRLLTAALLALAALPALAEKADADKPTEITYDSLDTDRVTPVSTATGNVIVTKGTLVLKSDKAVVVRSPDDYMVVTFTAANGKPATFRQKRDGGPDLWVEGEAQRIEYDERADVIKLFTKAKVRQLEGTKPTEQFESEFISYDSRKEALVARNDASGQTKPGKTRGMMIIAPRKPKPAAAGSATPAPATPPAAPATPAAGVPAGGSQ